MTLWCYGECFYLTSDIKLFNNHQIAISITMNYISVCARAKLCKTLTIFLWSKVHSLHFAFNGLLLIWLQWTTRTTMTFRKIQSMCLRQFSSFCWKWIFQFYNITNFFGRILLHRNFFTFVYLFRCTENAFSIHIHHFIRKGSWVKCSLDGCLCNMSVW